MIRMIVGLLSIPGLLVSLGLTYNYADVKYYKAEAIWAAIWIDPDMPGLTAKGEHQNYSVAFVQWGPDGRVATLEIGIILGDGVAPNYEARPRVILFWEQNGQYEVRYWPGELVHGWNTIALFRNGKTCDIYVNGEWWYNGFEVAFTRTPQAATFVEALGDVPVPDWPHVTYIKDVKWTEVDRLMPST